MFTTTKQTKRILVADHDPVTRHLISSVVQGEGFEVVTAADGREAYRTLQKDADFKAAIFEMMMTHLNGLDIIRFMATEKRLMRIPVMMVTSERDLKLMEQSLSAGALLFLHKPFTADQLQATVSILLSNSNLTTKAA
jgi:DNA-binding response OmpR family regulator